MDVSKENIYDLVGQEEIMRRYFPGNVSRNRKLKNPFRKDSKANCYFNWTRKGNFIFFDHTHPNFGGDAVSIVMLVYNITFREALLKINDDFNLGMKNYAANNIMTPLRDKTRKLNYIEKLQQQFKNFKRVHYKVEARPWTILDGNYWKDNYGISCHLLIKYNVTPVQKYYTRFWDEKIFKLRYIHSDNNPCYCASIKENNESTGIKLYKPLTSNPDDKWGSNTAYDALYGYEQLPDNGDLLIISSSLKDLLVLVTLGYNSVAPQSEVAEISTEKIQELKKRFKRIVVLYDLDSAGINSSSKLCLKHDLEHVMLPDKNNREGKDVADYRKQYGEEEMKKILLDII